MILMLIATADEVMLSYGHVCTIQLSEKVPSELIFFIFSWKTI